MERNHPQPHRLTRSEINERVRAGCVRIERSDQEHQQWRAHVRAVRQYEDVIAESCRQGWRLFADFLGAGVPDFDELRDRIFDASGWELVPVEGLIDPEEFMELVAEAKFPSSLWLRDPDEFEFSPDPDMLHEVLGHALQFVDGRTSDLYQLMAEKYLDVDKAEREGLERVWWYCAEVGLVEDPHRTAIGGAILSSPLELAQVRSADARPFDVAAMASTPYDGGSAKPWSIYFVAMSLREIVDALETNH